MSKVKEAHGAMLEAKRQDILENIVTECLSAIHQAAGDDPQCKTLTEKADTYYDQKKQQIAEMKVLALLDGLVPQMWQYKDDALERIEGFKKPPVTPPQTGGSGTTPVQSKKLIKSISRMAMFPGKTLSTDEEIDDYMEEARANMKKLLKDCDGIKLS